MTEISKFYNSLLFDTGEHLSLIRRVRVLLNGKSKMGVNYAVIALVAEERRLEKLNDSYRLKMLDCLNMESKKEGD